MLSRRIEAFNTALLPWQKPDSIREQASRFENDLLELEHGSRAEDLEKENAALIESQQAHLAEVLARRKARGKPVKPQRRQTSKVRRITQ